MRTSLRPGNVAATVHRADTASDRERVVAVLTLAFASDPALRWLYPDPRQYVEYFPQFLQAFAGKAFVYGSAYCAEDHSGAAMWLPPGVHADEMELDDVFTRSLGRRKADLTELFEAMGSYHPSEPHWYLPLIGVDPVRQGQGVGSALMQAVVDRCDLDGQAAYLESTSLSGNALYARLGFEALGIIEADGIPLLYPMVRTPRCSTARAAEQRGCSKTFP